MSTKTSALDNLVSLLTQKPEVDNNVTDVSTSVAAPCPVTQFIAKEDMALTLGDLRKKSAQGKLWGGEKEKALAGLHRRAVRYGIAKNLGNEHIDNARKQIEGADSSSNVNGDTFQGAVGSAILEVSGNLNTAIAEIQKQTKAINTLKSSLKKTAFK